MKTLSNQEPVRTRIAPSPTGYLHVGTARTALFNYLFAKQHAGEFYLRIEDTDKARSREEYVESIRGGLSWLGVSWNAEYRQSERLSSYRDALNKMVSSGTAYVSKEESKQKKGETVEVIRFKNPNKKITFTDAIRGAISFDTTELGDFIIAKSMNEPLYHLAVVVDDAELEISHVIRGEDHISNTPRQILLQDALDYTKPSYVHIPLILGPDRSKLSKRHGATDLSEYRDIGILPDALVNYLLLLGWAPKNDTEILSISEVLTLFNLEDIQKGGAIFDTEKLLWFNRQYLQRLPEGKIAEYVLDALPPEIQSLPQFTADRLARVSEELLERVSSKADILTLAEEGSLTYYFDSPTIDPSKLSWKDVDPAETKRHLIYVIQCITTNDTSSFKESIMRYAEKEGKGAVLWPIRYALCGAEKSPDPFTLLYILGKEEATVRLQAALDIL